MNQLKVLHITPWFPSGKTPSEGIFIWRHIKSILHEGQHEVLVIKFGSSSAAYETEKEGIKINWVTLSPIANKWIFKERAAHRFIRKYLNRNKEAFNTINFHIAYPNAIKIGVLKNRFPALNFIITEHWTAYHTHFNLKENSRGKKRIAAIFSHDVPVITVSRALGRDIKSFSGEASFDVHVVPNVIQTSTFNYQPKKQTNPFIFASINHWNEMKNPMVLIDAFAQVNAQNPETELKIGGSGKLIREMELKVKELHLSDQVTFLYQLTAEEVAKTLQDSHAYVQCSHYETFSVITAEALCTGTPVITNNYGGVLDFVSLENGILVDGLNPKNWSEAMLTMIEKYENYHHSALAANIAEKFNEKQIGKQYIKVLKELGNDEE